MKKYLFLVFALLMLSARLPAQDSVTATLSAAGSTCAVTNACLILPIKANVGGVTFTSSANASSNTLQFEATADGTTWVALNATPSNSTTAATSTTSTGTWQANPAGYIQVRIRMSTLVSGTATVTISTSTASAHAGGSAGGGGTIGGSISANQVAVGSGSNTISGSSAFTRDSTNGVVVSPTAAQPGVSVAGASSQTAPLLAVGNQGTGTADAPVSFHGVGFGSFTPGGFTALAHLETQSDATSHFGLVITNKQAIGSSGAPSSLTLTTNDLGVSSICGGNTVGDGSGNFGCITFNTGNTAIFPNPNSDTIVPFLVGNQRSTTTANILDIVDHSGTNLAFFDKAANLTAPEYLTKTNCSAASSSGTISCGAATAGQISCDTGTSGGTCVVDVSAVAATSEIFIQPNAANTITGVTCNTTSDTGLAVPRLASISAGTSFTINMGTFATNPECFLYWVVNP